MAFHEQKKPPGNKKEESIFKHILDNPGCIIPDIVKKYKLSEGMVRYHIRQLETNGKVTLKKYGRFTRLFTRNPALSDIEKS